MPTALLCQGVSRVTMPPGMVNEEGSCSSLVAGSGWVCGAVVSSPQAAAPLLDLACPTLALPCCCSDGRSERHGRLR